MWKCVYFVFYPSLSIIVHHFHLRSWRLQCVNMMLLLLLTPSAWCYKQDTVWINEWRHKWMRWTFLPEKIGATIQSYSRLTHLMNVYSFVFIYFFVVAILLRTVLFWSDLYNILLDKKNYYHHKIIFFYSHDRTLCLFFCSVLFCLVLNVKLKFDIDVNVFSGERSTTFRKLLSCVRSMRSCIVVVVFIFYIYFYGLVFFCWQFDNRTFPYILIKKNA